MGVRLVGESPVASGRGAQDDTERVDKSAKTAKANAGENWTSFIVEERTVWLECGEIKAGEQTNEVGDETNMKEGKVVTKETHTLDFQLLRETEKRKKALSVDHLRRYIALFPLLCMGLSSHPIHPIVMFSLFLTKLE